MKKNLEFKIGETVVYPKHGVGEIVKIESMEISSIKTQFYVVKMEQSKLIIRVPIDKLTDVGLRKISSKKIVDDLNELSTSDSALSDSRLEINHNHNGHSTFLGVQKLTFMDQGVLQLLQYLGLVLMLILQENMSKKLI